MQVHMVWSQKFRKSEISLDTGSRSGVKNLWKTQPESLFHFSSSRSLCGHFFGNSRQLFSG